MEPLKQFRYDLSTVKAQGLTLDEALVFVQMQQRERHHRELMRALESAALPTYVLTGDNGRVQGYEPTEQRIEGY